MNLRHWFLSTAIAMAAVSAVAADPDAVTAAARVAGRHANPEEEEVRHLKAGDYLYAFRVSKADRAVIAEWEKQGGLVFAIEKRKQLDRIPDSGGRAAWVSRADRILVVLDLKLAATIPLTKKPNQPPEPTAPSGHGSP